MQGRAKYEQTACICIHNLDRDLTSHNISFTSLIIHNQDDQAYVYTECQIPISGEVVSPHRSLSQLFMYVLLYCYAYRYTNAYTEPLSNRWGLCCDSCHKSTTLALTPHLTFCVNYLTFMFFHSLGILFTNYFQFPLFPSPLSFPLFAFLLF